MSGNLLTAPTAPPTPPSPQTPILPAALPQACTPRAVPPNDPRTHQKTHVEINLVTRYAGQPRLGWRDECMNRKQLAALPQVRQHFDEPIQISDNVFTGVSQ